MVQVTLNSVWEIRNAALIDRGIPEREADRILDRINDDQEDNRTDQVEVEMHHRCAARILRAAERRQEGCDTGANVLSQDDRDGGRPADHARRGERLQNADRGRGRLDDRSNPCADQHAQNRVVLARALRIMRSADNCDQHADDDTENERTKRDDKCNLQAINISCPAVLINKSLIELEQQCLQSIRQ